MATNASARPDSARIELGVQTRNATAILAIVLDENRLFALGDFSRKLNLDLSCVKAIAKVS